MSANYIEADWIVEKEEVLPKDFCDTLIAASEKRGYKAATINTERGARLITHIRNNKRVMYKDTVLAEQLWQRVKDWVPPVYGNSIAIGLNELFRFYRYEPGQQFARHCDESYIRNEEEASYFTLLFYLNEAYTGGQTVFDHKAVQGKTGSAFYFCMHCLTRAQQ
ncbi:MAG: 2OG-Fe(II) oxygenase [Bacteroidetes bacterium]|nr:2OG-Fe(II) oxygenase [Bacteroidota bacterium]